jgi:hypothetical protein
VTKKKNEKTDREEENIPKSSHRTKKETKSLMGE